MDLAYQGQQNTPYYQQYGGQRQQQQGQGYQNQQFMGQQQQYSNKGQHFQQQNMNSGVNQYENYHPQQQPQIEEESYDSSNLNNYTGDQYQMQQQKEYQQLQNQNYFKNGNQIQQQQQNFFQDEQGEGYFDSNNPSGQFYNQNQANQQNQVNANPNNKQNQIYLNEMYDDLNKRDDMVSPNDSLVSEINDNSPFEGYEDLQKDFKEDRVNEALDVCEQMIFNQHKVRGPASFMRLFQQILKFLNNEAVNSLNQNQFEKSLFILIKSKELTELSIIKNPPSIRALTFNNFGCYYRRLQQLPKALGYLEQALRFLNSIKSRDYLGMTYLNISAVLSQMNEHYASLENAKKAVIEIHKDYQNYLNRKSYQDSIKDQEFLDICQALAIAFYNVGVEQEFFQNYEVSLINYGKACEVCEDNLGSNHRLTRRFKELFQKFNEKLAKAEKKQTFNHKNHRAIVRPQSSQKNGLTKNRSFQNTSSYSHENNNGADKDQKNSQYIQNKVNPYKLSYGVKPNDFTQHGKMVYYKNSQQQVRSPSGNKKSISKMSRPNSSKSFYPEIKQNLNQISRPLSAKFQNTPNGGFFANSLTPKVNQQQLGLNRPFSAQAAKSNQIQFSQSKAPIKSSLSRPQNKNKKQIRDSSRDKDDGNQNIYDWVESPTNSSASGDIEKNVQDNQKDFLKSIKNEAEAQIQKLQQEEAELKERIEKLKQDEEEQSKLRDQRNQVQRKKEDEEAAKAKQNLIQEEEDEKKRIQEIQNKKIQEQQELEKIQRELKKQQEEELERIANLKQLKKKEEEEIERLRQQRAKEEEENQKKLQELERIKIEEENRLKKLKESIDNASQDKNNSEANLKNSQKTNNEEEQRIKQEKEEILQKFQQEKAEKERLQQEYEKIKKEQEEKQRILNENLLLKQEKEKLLEEISKLQNQKLYTTEDKTQEEEDQNENSLKQQEIERKNQEELEKKRKEELEKQQQIELEKKRQEELERQKQIEAEKQRHLELEKKREEELEKQKQIELEKKRQEELEEQKQIEAEKQKQLELEKQRQEELEKQKQIEAEKQKQIELEKQKQIEHEKQRKIELEKQQKEEQEKTQKHEKDSHKNKKSFDSFSSSSSSDLEEVLPQKKQKYQPNFECSVVKNVNQNYNLGIQTNVLDQIIVHAIPLWVDEKYPHLRRIINLSNIIEGKFKEKIAISLIQQIQISFSINSQKRKVNFAKRWSTTIDQKTYECNIRKDIQKIYYVEVDHQQNLTLISQIVEKTLQSTVSKVLDHLLKIENEKNSNKAEDQNEEKQKQQQDQQQNQNQEDQGIPEDELTVEKVKFIQGAFRDKKVKEKAKEDIKSAAKEFKKPLQNRIVQFGQHKLFLQCYKQITPEKYIIQVDSLNPKQLKLPKIKDQQEVEQEFIEKVVQSQNPFTEGLIYLNEEQGKIYFQKLDSPSNTKYDITHLSFEQQNSSQIQKEQEKKSNLFQEEEKDEYYDEDFKDDEVKSSPKNVTDQNKKYEKNLNYSFDSIEDKGQKNSNQNLDLSNQDIVVSKLVDKKQDYSHEQSQAAVKIQKNFKQMKTNQAKEITIKKQFFSLRLNDDNGDIQLVQGECLLTLQNKNYFLILLKSESIDELNAPMIKQQRIELGVLNKTQKQQILSNFSMLVNCNIGINKNHLVFEDVNMFLNPESTHISKVFFS